MVKENPFDREIIILKLNENSIIPRSSNIPRLDVFLDIRSILHVAGRLKNPLLICNLKYPILFPRRHEVIDMIVNQRHQKVAHSCRVFTLNCLRNSGFWVISGNYMCRSIISNCVMCKRLRIKLGTQKMAYIPRERTQELLP